MITKRFSNSSSNVKKFDKNQNSVFFFLTKLAVRLEKHVTS